MLIGIHHFCCIYYVGYCYVLIEVSVIIFGGECYFNIGLLEKFCDGSSFFLYVWELRPFLILWFMWHIKLDLVFLTSIVYGITTGRCLYMHCSVT
jgi:hypothetical protein